jgi:hypothetical protein
LTWEAKKHNQDYLYFDNKEFGPFESLYCKIYKRNVAIQFKIADSLYIQLGNNIWGPFEYILDNHFLKDGNFVFVAKKDFDSWGIYSKNKKEFIIETTTNKVIGPYYNINIHIFLDSLRYYYEALDRPINEFYGKNFIGIGESKIGPFDDIYVPWQERNTIIFSAKINNNWFLSDGNRRFGPFDEANEIVSSKKTSDYIFSGNIKGKDYIFDKDSKEGPYEMVRNLTLSPSGKILAYTSKQEDQWYVHIGNERAGPYSQLQRYMSFSPKEDCLDYITNEIDNSEKEGTSKLVKLLSQTYHHGAQKYGPFSPLDNIYGYYTSNNDFIFTHTERSGIEDVVKEEIYMNGDLIKTAKNILCPTNLNSASPDLIFSATIDDHDELWINNELIAQYSELDELRYNSQTKSLDFNVIENENIRGMICFDKEIKIGSSWGSNRVYIKNKKIVIDHFNN